MANKKFKGKQSNKHVKRPINDDQTNARNVGYGKTGTCDFHKSGPNDPRWYSLDDQLLFDSANVSYSWPLGNRLNLGQYGSELNNTAFPGIMAIYTMPTIGNASDANAPVNTAMRNIYSYVRHANSGASNYEAPDLMMYLLAMDSAYSFLQWMKRIYGVIRTYNPENRYYPIATIASMNVDFDDIQRNLADFRMYINVFATKIGSMCIPSSMSYMAKHSWMYQGLYLDSVSSKAQTYLFNPYAFLYYDQFNSTGTDDMTRGVLKLMPMVDRGARLTREDIYNIGNALINPILGSEDMNIMSGDILKAFGPEGLVQVSEITETYTVLPEYNMEVLDQIQNLTMVGDFVGKIPTDIAGANYDYVNHIGQVVVDQATDLFTGYLISNPRFCLYDAKQTSVSKPAGFNYMAANKPLTFQYDNITTFNTMEASRMMTFINPPTAAQNVYRYSNAVSTTGRVVGPKWVYDLATCGSEVACFARIYYYGIGSAGTWTLLNTEKFYTGHGFELTVNDTEYAPQTATNIPLTPAQVAEAFNEYNILLTKIEQFDRHPALVPVFRLGADGSANSNGAVFSSMNGILFDVDKYAIITPETQENMNQTALLSQFNVRQYGKAKSITNIMV